MRLRNRSLLILILLAFALRVAALGQHSLWYDEAFSVYVASVDLPTAWSVLAQDFHPPVYYALLRGALPLWGTSEFAARFLSALSGVLLVPLAWALGRRVFKVRVGLAAALLATVSPLYVWYAREARMYSQVTLLGLAATYALVRGMELRGKRLKVKREKWYAVMAACALAAIYSHYSALYLVLGLGVYWLTLTAYAVSATVQAPLPTGVPGMPAPAAHAQATGEKGGRCLFVGGRQAAGFLVTPWRVLCAFWPGAAAFGLLAAGVGVSAPHLLGFAQTARGFWPGGLDVRRAVVQSLQVLIGGQSLEASQATPLVWAGGLLALLALANWLRVPRGRQALWLVACSALVPAAINLAVLANRPKFEPRHLMVLLPPIWLLLAAGLVGPVRPRQLRITTHLILGVLLGGMLYADWNALASPRYARDDWRAAVHYVADHIEPDETLLLVGGYAFPAVWYYAGQAAVQRGLVDQPISWVALPDDVLLDVTHTLNYPVAARLNQALQGKSGAWLLQWQAQVIDPTGIVPTLLGDLGQAEPGLPAFTGIELRHVRFERPADFPPQPDVSWRLDERAATGLTLIGASLYPQPQARTDDVLALRAFWQADAPLPFGYRTSLRVLDERGIEYARADYDLAGPYYSTNLWAVGVPVMGCYTMSLPPGTLPGSYEMHALVYGQAEGPPSRMRLGRFELQRPAQAPRLSDVQHVPHSPALCTACGLAGELSLLEATFDPPLVKPCDTLQVRLVWQVGAPPPVNYAVRLELAGQQVDEALAGTGDTRAWQAGDVWQTLHVLPVACRAPDGTSEVQLTLYARDAGEAMPAFSGAIGSLQVDGQRRFDVPPVQHAVGLVFGDAFELVGYDIYPTGSMQPGGELTLSLYWRARRETGTSYTVFTHVESERLWGQHDGLPAGYPTDRWLAGEVVVDRHVLLIDPLTPAGVYNLVIGWYDLASGARLPITDVSSAAGYYAQDVHVDDLQIVLQSISIK